MAEFKIHPRTLRRHLIWRGQKELLCFRCGKKISPGDWIHRSNASCFPSREDSRRGKPRGVTRFYHLSCWEEMFV